MYRLTYNSYSNLNIDQNHEYIQSYVQRYKQIYNFIYSAHNISIIYGDYFVIDKSNTTSWKNILRDSYDNTYKTMNVFEFCHVFKYNIE